MPGTGSVSPFAGHGALERLRRWFIWAVVVGVITVPGAVALAMLIAGDA